MATAAARNDTAASVPQPEDSVPVATDESQAVTVNHVAGATGNNDDDNDKDNIADNSDFPPLEARPHSPAATPYQQQVFPPASNMNVKALPPARALGGSRGISILICLCLGLIVTLLLRNWKSICQALILMGFLFVFRGKAPQLYFIGLYTEWSKQVAETNFYFPQRCAWFGVLVRSCLMQHVYVSDYWSNERFIPIPNLWPFPLPLCLNTPQSVVKVQASDDVYMGTSLQMVDWGQLPVDIMSNYMHMSDSLLSDIVLPGDVVTCSGGKCTNQCHVNMISNTHDGIMNCLQELMKCVLPEKKYIYILLQFQGGMNIVTTI